MEILPYELIIMVMEYLDAGSKARFLLSCKYILDCVPYSREFLKIFAHQMCLNKHFNKNYYIDTITVCRC